MMTAGSNDLMIDGNQSPPLYPRLLPREKTGITFWYIKAVVDDQQIQISSLKYRS